MVLSALLFLPWWEEGETHLEEIREETPTLEGEAGGVRVGAAATTEDEDEEEEEEEEEEEGFDERIIAP